MTLSSQHAASTSVPPGARPTRVRFVVLAMLAVATMINYLDRTILGIAAPTMTRELALSPAVMGVVFSAFSWAYAAFQIPGGIFLDRFGSKLTYFLAFTCWSGCTALLGLAAGLKSLLATLFGLGACEAPCFPTNSRVVGTWFPQTERGVATSIYTVGEYIGLASFSPLLYWILQQFGWRALFISVGLSGIAFALVWWVLYREPHESRSVNQAELDLIAAGGGLGAASKRIVFSGANIRALLSHRQIWGACIGQFGGNSTLVFFLTWFPTYLATERQMAWLKVGFFAVMPFLAAAIGVIFGGWASDKLLKKTGSANLARKLPMIAGLLGASTDHRGELRPERRARHCRHVGRVLLAGHDGSWVDADLRHRAEEPGRADRRGLQPVREPRGNRDADRDRSHRGCDRLVLLRAGLRGSGGPPGGRLVHLHPGRRAPARDRLTGEKAEEERQP